MTRKLILVTLTALMVPSGCVKTSTTGKGPEQICFDPVVGAQVRSADVTETFPKDESFRVSAITSSNNVFFNDAEITFEQDVWTSPLLPKWEQGVALRFNGYAPANANLTGFKPDEDPTDLLITDTDLIESTPNPVTLTFTHALSQVELRIRNGLPVGSEIRIQSISIGPLYSTGSLNPYEAPLWTPEGEPEYFELFKLPEDSDPLTEGLAVNRDEYTDLGEIRAIPQNGRATIKIVAALKYPTTAWETDIEWVTETPISIVWLAGRKYTYSISMLDNEIKYTTGISSWNQ